MTSLVGHLVTRFAAHPEDLATEALAYILQASHVARQGFLEHLSDIARDLPNDLVFRTQVSGDDFARPDLVGFDDADRQRIIVEAKFWAGLTDNQPNTYIRRLPSDASGVLVFIAPKSRLETLWPELLQRMKAEHPAGALDQQRLRWQVGERHWIALTSWRAIINTIDARLTEAGEVSLCADLKQLDGLCDRMDSDAFFPLSLEEFSPLIGKRLIQYGELIEDVVTRLSQKEIADVRGLRTIRMPGRWGRYMRLKGNGCLLYFYAHAWAYYRETPLWLWVKDHNWHATAEIRKALSPLEHEIPSRLYIDKDKQNLVPLFLPTGVEREEVLQSLVKQIVQVAELLPDHHSDPASDKDPAAETVGDS